MEEIISGFKLRGDWGDIVEHGERITRALRDAGVHDPDRDADARRRRRVRRVGRVAPQSPRNPRFRRQ